MGKTSKRNRNKGKTDTSQNVAAKAVNRKRKADGEFIFEKNVGQIDHLYLMLNSVIYKGIDNLSTFALTDELRGNEKIVFSLIISSSESRVALHGEKNYWIPTASWEISRGLQNYNVDLGNTETCLGIINRYFLTGNGSVQVFGLDCEHENFSLETRMNIQNCKRGHGVIFFILSDVPHLTRLYQAILEACSIKVIEMNKVTSFCNLAHLVFAKVLKDCIEEIKANGQVQQRYRTRSSNKKHPDGLEEYIKAYKNQGQKEINPEVYIGARVAKYFFKDNPELFLGSVKQYCRHNGYWLILYDDGDREEFDFEELVEGMKLRDQTSSGKDFQTPSRSLSTPPKEAKHLEDCSTPFQLNDPLLQQKVTPINRRILPSRTVAPTLKYPTEEQAKHELGVEVTKTGGNKGLNVIATKVIKKHTILSDYKGTIVDKLDPNSDYSFIIDAGLYAGKVLQGKMNEGIAASINHSCKANCEALLIKGTSESKEPDTIVIRTIRKIEPNEELTLNYCDKDEVGAFFNGGMCLCEECGGQNWTENALKFPAPAGTQHSSLYIVNVEMTEEEQQKHSCTNACRFIWG